MSQPQSGEHAWHVPASLLLPAGELEGDRFCDKVAQRNGGRRRKPNHPLGEGDTLPQAVTGWGHPHGLRVAPTTTGAWELLPQARHGLKGHRPGVWDTL